MGEEMKCHFGKWDGTPLSEIPVGYLKWCVKTIDPVPLPKYQKDESGKQLPLEEVKQMEANMRAFLQAAEIEIGERG